MTERVLFAAHRGDYRGRPAGIIMDGHCLPLSVVGDPDDGIPACWGYHCGSPEAFFEALDIDHATANGPWVYEVEWDREIDGRAADDDDDWTHLQDGELRRPTHDEMAALARNEPPWPGGTVL